MKRTRPDVTDAELLVLKALWDRGPSTIRALTTELYPTGDAAHYSTVQKLLERLEAKACVRRRPEGRVNVFSAAVGREALIVHRLQETADKLCEGSLTPLLSHLVDGSKLTADEVSALRELVERLDHDPSRS